MDFSRYLNGQVDPKEGIGTVKLFLLWVEGKPILHQSLQRLVVWVLIPHLWVHTDELTPRTYLIIVFYQNSENILTPVSSETQHPPS